MALANACRNLVNQRYLHLYNARPLDSETLVSRVTNSRSSLSPVIPRGSHIVVGHGIAVLVISNGTVVACYDRPGSYSYDDSQEPSLFCNDGLPHLLKTLVGKYQLGGQNANIQYVVSINTRQICMNPLTLTVPVPLMIGNGLSASVRVRLKGTFKLQIMDPVRFFNSIAFSELDDSFDTEILQEAIEEQIRGQFASVLASLCRDSITAPHLLQNFNSAGATLALHCSGKALQVSDICFSSIDIDIEDQTYYHRLQQIALYGGPHSEAVSALDHNRAMLAFSLRPGSSPGDVYGLGLYREIVQEDRSGPKLV